MLNGEYIAFLDSDDYVELTMYEKLYNKAKLENSDMVECDFIWEYPSKIKKDVGILYFSKKEAIEKARVVAWNKIYKREIIFSTNIRFPIGLRYEDVEFFYKIVPFLNKVSFVKECLVHYVQRDNSIANTQNNRTTEIFIIFDNVFKYYKEQGLFQEYYEVLEYSYIRILLCSSLKRICKINDKKVRKEACLDTFKIINFNFPNWRKNNILKKRSLKNLYIRSCNKGMFCIYCIIFRFL